MKTPECIQHASSRSQRTQHTAGHDPRPPSQSHRWNGSGRSKAPKPPPEDDPSEPAFRAPVAEKTAYHLYLREIGEIPLLTPEEETELALRVQRGDEAAREHMIKANLRLVVKIARDYEGMGVPLLDLINEGNIGLMKAVERFDPDKGAKLSTYSALWIKQSIRRALANQGRDVRLPVHVHDKLSAIQSCILRYREKHGVAPSPEEIGREIGLPTRKVVRLLESSKRPASLDASLNETDGHHDLGNAIADEQAENPFECLARDNALHLMKRFFNCLKPRELDILNWRFGLDGGQAQTLEEIGQRLNLTREAVRQIQNRALGKLRGRFHQIDRPPLGVANVEAA